MIMFTKRIQLNIRNSFKGEDQIVRWSISHMQRELSPSQHAQCPYIEGNHVVSPFETPHFLQELTQWHEASSANCQNVKIYKMSK